MDVVEICCRAALKATERWSRRDCAELGDGAWRLMEPEVKAALAVLSENVTKAMEDAALEELFVSVTRESWREPTRKAIAAALLVLQKENEIPGQ